MALETLVPLTYSHFIEETERSIRGIIDYFNNEDSEFWLKTLLNYSFREQDFLSGENTRLNFNRALSSCSEDGKLNVVANSILEWGGMQHLTPAMSR
jgi:DNA helicase HerA-like ATPase